MKANFHTGQFTSAWQSVLILISGCLPAVAEFVEPQTPTESKIFEKLLERRAFTPAEVSAIDQNADSVIDVRDLAIYYRNSPKPPYAFFPAGESRLIAGVQGTGSVTVYFTKPFTGTLRYQLSGDAVKDVDFLLSNGEVARAGGYEGTLAVSNATTAQIPAGMATKTKLTGSKSLMVALLSYRDVATASERSSLGFGTAGESTAKYVGYRVRQVDTNTVWRTTSININTRIAAWTQESGSGYDVGPASAHRVDLHEADRGVFRGVLKFFNGSGLDQQTLLVAVRSNGVAFFDTTDAKLFNGSFSMPVTFSGNGGVTFAQPSSQATGSFPGQIGGRTVGWTLRLREQFEATAGSEAARLGLNLQTAGLSVGDRVRQSDTGGLWTLLDDRFPDSRATWRPQGPNVRSLAASFDLTNLAATPYAAKGVLELSVIEPAIAP